MVVFDSLEEEEPPCSRTKKYLSSSSTIKLNSSKVSNSTLPLDFSTSTSSFGMKRVLDHPSLHHHHSHNHHGHTHHGHGNNNGRVGVGGGGKMTRLHNNNNNNNSSSNHSSTTSPSSGTVLHLNNNSITSSSLVGVATPTAVTSINPMLLSRLVLPARPSPGGSESPPPHHHPDFSDDDDAPKDFRGKKILQYVHIVFRLAS
jgi:hypothetical protein